MREMGNWREYFIERLAADCEAALDYLQLTLEEYQVDGDLPFFLKELRTFVESQGGISELSKRTGIEAETLLDALTDEDAPRLDTLNIISNALKHHLLIKNFVKYKRQCRDMLESVRFNQVDSLVGTHVSLETATYLP